MQRTSKKGTQNGSSIQKVLPVVMSDLAVIDDNFPHIRAKFAEEMKRINEEMIRFSENLNQMYAQTIPAGLSHTSIEPAQSPAAPQALVKQTTTVAPVIKWDTMDSTLIENDGDVTKLKIQFDVSNFDPEEVTVNINDNMITVSAVHEENSSEGTIHYEYNKQFLLPLGVDVDSLVSSLSSDGVLTIHTPLP